MDSDFEIVDSQELREELLLQLLAVFVRRFGGEAVITSREFDMVGGLDVIAQQITPEHLRLRIDEGGMYILIPEEGEDSD